MATNNCIASNPVKNNFLTRYLFGFAVIVAMMIGGGAVGGVMMNAGIPYEDWIGVAVGAIIVFAAFVVLYPTLNERTPLGERNR